mmetsp:Transcript_46315/g.119013  ORF Transcript_46315/g.119013 Transcript_46315/m.119013 type:complete len:574 (-) Transcript_46315:115-1836(-)
MLLTAPCAFGERQPAKHFGTEVHCGLRWHEPEDEVLSIITGDGPWSRKVWQVQQARRRAALGAAVALRCTEEEVAYDMLSAQALRDIRCKSEVAKEAITWSPITIEDVKQKHTQSSPGVFYGLEFPWNADLLVEFGPEWLTKAFHAAGTLDANNSVTAVIPERKITITAGNNAAKILFEVRYAKPTADLHTKLFAKIPWPNKDKTRSDRMLATLLSQAYGERAEINASRLLESRLTVRVPKFYFGDISNESTNWILITERIPFDQQEGENKVDPAYEKCRDWELKGDVRDYYYLLVRVGARVSGAYCTEKLAPKATLDKFFDNSSARQMHEWSKPEPEAEFDRKFKFALDFLQIHAKAIFPEAIATAEFAKSYRHVLATVNAYKGEIEWWCQRKPEYVAWCHGNLNVDNVFFWRDPAGKLDCGVLDWGGASTSSLGWKLWWWLYGCEYEFLNDNIDGLLKCFIDELHANGGPPLEFEELKLQFVLAAMSQGVGLLGAVPQIYGMCAKKQWETITERRDPRIAENVHGKNTLRIYISNFSCLCRMISEWGIPDILDKWVDEFCELTKSPKKTVA